MDEPAQEWHPGDHILVELPEGQTARCRIVGPLMERAETWAAAHSDG